MPSRKVFFSFHVSSRQSFLLRLHSNSPDLFSSSSVFLFTSFIFLSSPSSSLFLFLSLALSHFFIQLSFYTLFFSLSPPLFFLHSTSLSYFFLFIIHNHLLAFLCLFYFFFINFLLFFIPSFSPFPLFSINVNISFLFSLLIFHNRSLFLCDFFSSFCVVIKLHLETSSPIDLFKISDASFLLSTNCHVIGGAVWKFQTVGPNPKHFLLASCTCVNWLNLKPYVREQRTLSSIFITIVVVVVTDVATVVTTPLIITQVMSPSSYQLNDPFLWKIRILDLYIFFIFFWGLCRAK